MLVKLLQQPPFGFSLWKLLLMEKIMVHYKAGINSSLRNDICHMYTYTFSDV